MTVIAPLTFSDFQRKIKIALARGLRARQIKPRDLVLILTIFSKAENIQELHLLVELFQDDYAPFAELIDEEKYQLQKDFESLIREFISHVIMDNPHLAAEISQSALMKDANLETLQQQYPEFREFIAQKNERYD